MRHATNEACVCAGLRQRILDLARAGRTPASLAREFEPTETTIRN